MGIEQNLKELLVTNEYVESKNDKEMKWKRVWIFEYIKQKF